MQNQHNTSNTAITKIQALSDNIEQVHSASRRLINILQSLAEGVTEPGFLEAPVENAQLLNSRIEELSLSLSVFKHRINEASDIVFDEIAEQDNPGFEIERLREVNRLLTHKISESRTQSDHSNRRIEQLEELLQESLRIPNSRIVIDEDDFFIASVRTNALKESSITENVLEVQSFLQDLTRRVFLLLDRNTDIKIGDWVRFQLDINSFPIGRVIKIGINKIDILYQLVTFSRELAHVLVKSEYKPLSNSRLDRDIVLAPGDPFFFE